MTRLLSAFGFYRQPTELHPAGHVAHGQDVGASGRRSPVAARCGPWPRLSQGNASEGHGAGGGDYVARDGESGVASFGSRHGPARGRLPVGLEGQCADRGWSSDGWRRCGSDGRRGDRTDHGAARPGGPCTIVVPNGPRCCGPRQGDRQPHGASTRGGKPNVESHRTATGRTICFTPIALSRPASFQRFLGDGTHRFRGCCYRAFLLWRRFLDRGVLWLVFFPGPTAGLLTPGSFSASSRRISAARSSARSRRFSSSSAATRWSSGEGA